MARTAVTAGTIDYPDSGGLPMEENESQFWLVLYVGAALDRYFLARDDVYVIGNPLRAAMGREGFQKLRQQHRPGRPPKAPIPKTRRLAYAGGAAQWPMGWVKLSPLNG